MTYNYSIDKLVQETTASGYVHDDEEDDIGDSSNNGGGYAGHDDGIRYSSDGRGYFLLEHWTMTLN